ncbi:MAG: hypothetical protein J5J00_08960 [Deltaproteobacteria bacterium]|nr:hypothetical protein [Deltaproteobacteria bacterium]
MLVRDRAPYFLLQLLISINSAFAIDLSESAGPEFRYFPSHSATENTHHSNFSFYLEPNFRYKPSNESIVEVQPFGRFDEHDEHRTHGDLREAYYEQRFDKFRVKIGVSRENWGVASSYHVIHIINQTDLIEHPVYQRMLGQPMVNLNYGGAEHEAQLFLLPWFRERPFAGKDARIRLTPRVDNSRPIFESDAENERLDLAARYRLETEPLKMGIYHFWGTSRDPSPVLGSTADGEQVILPYYPTIRQAGLDAKAKIASSWYPKIEWIHRKGQGPSFNALIGGIEYLWSDFKNTGADLLLIAEYHYGDNGSLVVSPFDNDWFAGFILSLNDDRNTQIILGDVFDTKSDTSTPLIGLFLNVAKKCRLEIEYRGLLGSNPGHPLHPLAKDDFLQVVLIFSI